MGPRLLRLLTGTIEGTALIQRWQIDSRATDESCYNATMGAFFKSWRRKAGCVALALACFSLGLWVRGHVIEDGYNFGDGTASRAKGRHVVSSYVSGVMWSRHSVPDGQTFKYVAGWYSHYFDNGELLEDVELDPSQFEWRWELCGFVFGRSKDSHNGKPILQVSFWHVPYWALIWLPLLLSCYLLLWKPRKLARVRPTITN